MSHNLENLVKTIRNRKESPNDKSYTTSLLSGGLPKCIDRMQEEFDEFKDICEVIYLPRTPDISTTELIKRIKEL